MPIYEYKCEKCGNSFEKLVFSSDKEPVSCPECKANDVKRLLSSTGFISNTGGSSCSTGAPSGFS
ncbi:MAG TPA: zinc ribbon domain-containing protein [Desulfobacterales bacterium]|nr:zinc ribbon domain-containing protein [Desulfobacterales bacterium]